jgi:uncharacterized membrane protein YdjX (TVP38/TMEM64 family)
MLDESIIERFFTPGTYMSRNELIKKILLFIACAVGTWLLYEFTPLKHYFSLGYVKEQSDHYKSLLESHYYTVVLCYMAVFIATVALSMPSSIILTLLGGSLFGTVAGALYAIISVVIGVTCACLVYKRFFFKSLGELYVDRIAKFRVALKEYGVSYLLMLHFSAIFPYFIINSLALFADVPLRTIIWTTFVGFFPQAFVYAFAGKELASIRSVRDIFSPAVVLAFALLILLACIPILFKKFKKNFDL